MQNLVRLISKMINMTLKKIKYAFESLNCQEIYLTELNQSFKKSSSTMCTQSVHRAAIKRNICIFIKHKENPKYTLNPLFWDYFSSKCKMCTTGK